jgi:hypothetical protein
MNPNGVINMDFLSKLPIEQSAAYSLPSDFNKTPSKNKSDIFKETNLRPEDHIHKVSNIARPSPHLKLSQLP